MKSHLTIEDIAVHLFRIISAIQEQQSKGQICPKTMSLLADSGEELLDFAIEGTR
jgi:hypothetical protein